MTMQHRAEQSLAIPDGEGIRPNDLRPPFLVLVQRDEGAGEWRRTDTNETSPDLQVIPLRLWQTRRKWPRGDYQSDRKPECWSTNGREAAPGAKYEGRHCFQCEFHRENIFTMSDEEDGKGGACAPTYAAIVITAFSFEPLLLNLGSKTMYRLASSLETNMRSAIVELSAKWFEGKKGKWYSPQAKRVARLEQDDTEQVAAMYRRFVGMQVDVMQHDEETPVTETPLEAPSPNGNEQVVKDEQPVESYSNAEQLPF